jgi:hypothetical protein
MWWRSDQYRWSRVLRILCVIGLAWFVISGSPRLFGAVSWPVMLLVFFVLLPRLSGYGGLRQSRRRMYEEMEKPKNDFADEKPKTDVNSDRLEDDHRYIVGDDGELVDADAEQEKPKRDGYI